MKQLKLLPNRWQRIGLIVVLISIVMCAFGMKGIVSDIFGVPLKDGAVPYAFGQIWGVLLWKIVIPAMGITMAFSMEKIEDERTSVIRTRALTTSIIIYLAFSFVVSCVTAIYGHLADPHTCAKLLQSHKFLFGIGIVPFIYLICFKLSLGREQRNLKKPGLLPHRWQVIGLVVAGLCISCFIISRWGYLILHNSSKPFQVMSALIILCTPALTIAAFSREKNDDERTMAIRRQALPRAAILLVIMVIATTVISFFITRRIPIKDIANVQFMVSMVKWLSSWSAFVIYYLFIFKLSLHKENNALKYEE